MLSQDRGDTLIEVVFAAAVLALIIVLGIGIMNRATAQTERAVEGTFVRQSIDSQTELLRYARDSFVNGNTDAATLWNTIKGKRMSPVTRFNQIASKPDCKPTSANAFWLSTDGSKVTLEGGFSAPGSGSSPVYASPGNGIWIEATSASTANYVDFYVYACWDAPGSGPKATTGTVVRLYAPAA